MWYLMNEYFYFTCSFDHFDSGDDRPRVPIFVRKSTLRLPFRPVCPVIMVGPGTG